MAAEKTMSEIPEPHRRLRKMFTFLTHDEVEAMTTADKIVVLNAANTERVGSPLDLYHSGQDESDAGACLPI